MNQRFAPQRDSQMFEVGQMSSTVEQKCDVCQLALCE